jgi:hypothetical protein
MKPIRCFLGRYRDAECLAISIGTRKKFEATLREWPPHFSSPLYKSLCKAGLPPMKPGEIRRVMFVIEEVGKPKKRPRGRK